MSISCMVIIALYAGFGVLTLLMALVKKPIGIIVFDILTLGVFKLIQFDFKDRGVALSNNYDLGIVNYLTYVIGIVILVGAVLLFIEKRKAKQS